MVIPFFRKQKKRSENVLNSCDAVRSDMGGTRAKVTSRGRTGEDSRLPKEYIISSAGKECLLGNDFRRVKTENHLKGEKKTTVESLLLDDAEKFSIFNQNKKGGGGKGKTGGGFRRGDLKGRASRGSAGEKGCETLG